ncbi:unnamed protein product, partial [marine sediment metagenome]
MPITVRLTALALVAALAAGVAPAAEPPLNQPPEGFTAIFNGKDLEGWWGLGTVHYNKYRDLAPDALEQMKAKSRADIRQHWR